jgi:hypothetical protein
MGNIIENVTNTSVEDQELLYKIFNPTFEFIQQKDKIPYLVYVFDYAVKYINENHQDLNSTWKALIMVYLKYHYINGHIITDDDIVTKLNEIINLYRTEYPKYISELGLSASEFDRDYSFICRYMKQKNQ